MRIAHYINQFFGGIGGEDKADHPFEVRQGAVGPGVAMRMALSGADEVVETAVCGDNYVHEHRDSVRADVARWLERVRPDLLIAGPAFNAGRYGAACGEVCAIAVSLGIPAVTAMHEDNPAVPLYRQRIYILPAGATARAMVETIGRLVSFGQRLAAAAAIGLPQDEGYLPRGIRLNTPVARSGAERAVDMLLDRLRGRPFVTEVPLATIERTPPAPAVGALPRAKVALISTGGIVPMGNPDRLKHMNEVRWRRYPVAGVPSMSPAAWEPIHGGYDASWARANPNVVVPLDAMRALEAEGAIGALDDHYYAVVGVGSSVAGAEQMGREIAAALVRDGVDAAILTST